MDEAAEGRRPALQSGAQRDVAGVIQGISESIAAIDEASAVGQQA